MRQGKNRGMFFFESESKQKRKVNPSQLDSVIGSSTQFVRIAFQVALASHLVVGSRIWGKARRSCFNKVDISYLIQMGELSR